MGLERKLSVQIFYKFLIFLFLDFHHVLHFLNRLILYFCWFFFQTICACILKEFIQWLCWSIDWAIRSVKISLTRLFRHRINALTWIKLSDFEIKPIYKFLVRIHWPLSSPASQKPTLPASLTAEEFSLSALHNYVTLHWTLQKLNETDQNYVTKLL